MNTTTRTTRRPRQTRCTACVNCAMGDRHWTRFAALWADIAKYKTRMLDLQAGRGWVRVQEAA